MTTESNNAYNNCLVVDDDKGNNPKSTMIEGNDSDLENRVEAAPQKNAVDAVAPDQQSDGKTVLGASKRFNNTEPCNESMVNSTQNDLLDKSASADMFEGPENKTEKETVVLEEENSETEALSDTEDPEDEAPRQKETFPKDETSKEEMKDEEADVEEDSDSMSTVSAEKDDHTEAFVEEGMSVASVTPKEEAYKEDCKEFLLQLTKTTVDNVLKDKEEEGDANDHDSVVNLIKDAAVSDDDKSSETEEEKVAAIEVTVEEAVIENAPSDEREYLFQEAVKKEEDESAIEERKNGATKSTHETLGEETRPLESAPEERTASIELAEDDNENDRTNFVNRSSFGSRYKSGLIDGLSLESKNGTFPKPQVERPSRASLGSNPMRSPESTVINSSKLSSPRVSSPNLNTRNLLKMYNVSQGYICALHYCQNLFENLPNPFFCHTERLVLLQRTQLPTRR